MSIKSASPGPEVRTLIDELLTEQGRDLSAVERFSRAHTTIDSLSTDRRHRDLIPLSVPRPGEQYAFEVDLDRCSGCKGCVTACHALNGLDDSESWREVGLLLGELHVPVSKNRDAGNRVIPWQQTVTTACHHCVEPACLLGCPVLAYDKDPITGIVRHLDDQCIGCSYCILKCPYEVPQFSAERGIVRKCDMCQGRLAVGEAPACVQACPNEAILITTVKTEWVSVELRKRRPTEWLPDAPSPDYSLPTTRYLSKAGQPQLAAADHHRNRPASPHWPLLLMLVLTQLGMGGMLAAWVTTHAPTRGTNAGISDVVGRISLGLFLMGLVMSVLHLGQPRKAWRAWLGWRTSWMSREVIVLNLTLGVALVTAGLSSPALLRRIQTILGTHFTAWTFIEESLHAIAPMAFAGLMTAAVLAQIMVYADTHRTYWSWAHTGPRFVGTFVISAALAGALIDGWAGFAAIAMLVKLALEIRPLQHGSNDAPLRNQLQRSAQLITGPLRPVFVLRLLLGGASVLSLLIGPHAGGSFSGTLALAMGTFVAGELAERWLFFAGVSPDKMPGLP